MRAPGAALRRRPEGRGAFFVATTGGTGRPALTRWRPALRALAVVLVMALGVTGMTACGNNNQPEQISRPVDDQGHTLYGPVVNGVAYCGWVLSADECKDATEPTGTPIPAEHWVKMPDQTEAQAAGQSVEPLLQLLRLSAALRHCQRQGGDRGQGLRAQLHREELRRRQGHGSEALRPARYRHADRPAGRLGVRDRVDDRGPGAAGRHRSRRTVGARAGQGQLGW